MVLILANDDDLLLVERFGHALSQRGSELIIAKDGFEAIRCLEHTSFDLIIAKSDLPKMNGWEFAEYLYLIKCPTPLLFITTQSDLDENYPHYKINPVEIVLKPISQDDLILKVAKILMNAPCNEEVQIKKNLNLTRKETALFQKLSSSDRVFSKEELLAELCEDERDLSPHTVEVHINNLRKKINGENLSILSVRGKGYKLQQMKNAIK